MSNAAHKVSADLEGETLAAGLRRLGGNLSWSVVKKLIAGRKVLVNGALATNDARRLKTGDELTVLQEPYAQVVREQEIRLLHIDPDLVVVDKPPFIVSQRPDQERNLSEEKKALQPTLDEMVMRLLPSTARRPPKPTRRGRTIRNTTTPVRTPVYVVHRLDRDTSGLMLFALSPRAREAFIDLFARHVIERTYHAVCLGHVDGPRTFDTHIIRDRGDGLRGSTLSPNPDAKRAITHVRPVSYIGSNYTLLECRLETGRTHQIRIHLAEAGHMLCGEKLYTRPTPETDEIVDKSGAPRQALHSKTLAFGHPFTSQKLTFESPLPSDLSTWLERLKRENQPFSG